VVDTIRLIEFGNTEDTDTNYQSPNFFEDFDLDVYTIKVDLAGIPKENISLKAAKHSIKLTITTDNADEPREHNLRLIRQIDPYQAITMYKDGLLTISAPIDDGLDFSFSEM